MVEGGGVAGRGGRGAGPRRRGAWALVAGVHPPTARCIALTPLRLLGLAAAPVRQRMPPAMTRATLPAIGPPTHPQNPTLRRSMCIHLASSSGNCAQVGIRPGALCVFFYVCGCCAGSWCCCARPVKASVHWRCRAMCLKCHACPPSQGPFLSVLNAPHPLLRRQAAAHQRPVQPPRATGLPRGGGGAVQAVYRERPRCQAKSCRGGAAPGGHVGPISGLPRQVTCAELGWRSS